MRRGYIPSKRIPEPGPRTKFNPIPQPEPMRSSGGSPSVLKAIAYAFLCFVIGILVAPFVIGIVFHFMDLVSVYFKWAKGIIR